ncbi:putative metabolite transport protein CsbC [Isoptericola dokdonensis DS-3]|jgi:SP family sugar:H+ symporter-like MFS transporter|uniref:Putative metabolite transport protein CsbC n=2 Tax=Isoptericola TaxID=254250 RepID=A0A161I246_9MICO|nr:sugar porter family MFS transporter [Isoptericola dokdonensis]ANC31535.1 putative metabolite transport protein CsbC [Isoptericola dokdonensis DS-3]
MSDPVPAGTDARGAHRKAMGLAISAAVGGFLFGFDSSVINGAVEAIEGQFELDSSVTGLVVAVALLGCALGAWGAGRLADRWGRIRIMVLGSGLFLVSSILSAIAWSALDLSIWRFMAGVGIGIASVIAPAYIAEIAPATIRGTLGSMQQLAITVGIFAALLSDQLLAEAAGGAANELWLGWEAWRWMFMVGVVPAIVYGVLALRMPESPRFLVARGRVDEARSVLDSVLGPEENVGDRIDDIQRSIAMDEKNAEQGSLRGNGFLGLKSIVWVGILLAVFQQFVGINVIFYYSTTLWQAVGFDESQAFLVSTITAVTNIAVTFIAIALIDKVGRRPLLLIGSAGMAVSLLAMAAVFTQGTTTVDAATGESTLSLGDPWATIALIGANAFVVFFGATWGPLMWVMLGEMFPNRIRAAALGLAAAVNWIANFTITLTFPPMLSNLGPAVPYGLYGTFAALSFFFVLWKVDETKGKELEDMTEDVRHR